MIQEASLSWCDKLASVPGVGLTLDWHFASGDAILTALSPILDGLVRDDKALFSVTRQDQFGIGVNLQDGFSYGIDSSKVYVSFQHNMRPKAVSGGPPIMEMLSHPMPYTKLLATALDMLAAATLTVPGNKARKINKVGIVSNTVVDPDEAPPGILRFIEYVSRPWKGFVDGYSFQMITLINKGEKWTDKCIHNIIKPDNANELLTLSFDWQRTFASGQAISKESINRILDNAQRDALDYLENLAEGGMFDADINCSST